MTLFTDGSCLGNPGSGGWACLLRWGPVERTLSGAEQNTTNNRMELTAVIEALSMGNQNNCSTLVTLAKTERNRELQTELVRQLSNVTNRCPAAREYMIEILK